MKTIIRLVLIAGVSVPLTTFGQQSAPLEWTSAYSAEPPVIDGKVEGTWDQAPMKGPPWQMINSPCSSP